ncbi:hypothetical protein ID866_4232 [Astraeus odoratus]|nr:hypothetical protein ID866_4232 [Astraeus odoratus]
MGISCDSIPDSLIEWLLKQQIFWVATAAMTGHVNVSPKSTSGCFHIADKNKVWYEDLTGSGIETIAHLREPGNGRITILFHALEGAPRILRMWGTGVVYEFGTPEYDAFIPPEKRKAGSRAAIVINVHKVATACGFGVPLYKFQSHRTSLERLWDSFETFDRSSASPSTDLAVQSLSKDSEKVGPHPKGIKAWWTTENLSSLDGLPGLQHAHQTYAVPTSAFNRSAPDKYGRMVRLAEEVGDNDAERITQCTNGKENVGVEWKDKSNNVAGDEKTKAGRHQQLVKGWNESLKVLGAFSLGVLITIAYFRLVTALPFRST